MSQARIKLLRKRLRKFQASHAQMPPTEVPAPDNAPETPPPAPVIAQPAEPSPLPSPGGRGETEDTQGADRASKPIRTLISFNKNDEPRPPAPVAASASPESVPVAPKPVRLRRCRYCGKTDHARPNQIMCVTCAKLLLAEMHRERHERLRMLARMRELAVKLYPFLRERIGRLRAVAPSLLPSRLYLSFKACRVRAGNSLGHRKLLTGKPGQVVHRDPFVEWWIRSVNQH